MLNAFLSQSAPLNSMGGGQFLYIKHLHILRFSISAIAIIAVMLFANPISLTADFEPCESEEPVSIICETVGSTGIMIGLFDCETIDPLDEPCRIEVEYCVRFYSVNGNLEPRVEIIGVKLLNCDNECNQHIWAGALVIMALNKDLPVPFETYDFFYQAATCWKPKPIGPNYGLNFGYDRCNEGECCVGFYHISRDFDENGNKVITIEFISRLTKMTHYCTPPCTFTDCESTIPNEVFTFTDNGTGVYYPKISLFEIQSTNGLYLSPNPVDENLQVKIFSKEAGILKLSIYDIYGRLVSNSSLNKHNNETMLNINTSGLASGIYNVVVSLNDLHFPNKSFIKIK